jgi:nitronate monooxygenase
MSLWSPLCARLGIDYPIVQAPIGGAAIPALAAAASEAGALGMVTMSRADAATIRQRMAAMRALTSRPFGVNLILQDEQRPQLEACLAEGATIVSYFWRNLRPGDPYVEEAHAAGATVMLTVGSADEARRAVDAGVDIVVAQGIEAGGHVWGTVGTLSLVPAVVDAISPTPVVAAGGIGDGRGLAAVLALGAQAGWLGTRFLLSDESPVHPAHVRAAIDATETDTILSELFDGGWPDAPHRTLVNSTVRSWLAAGSPPAERRPGLGEVIGHTRAGEPILRYAVDHPTTERVVDGEAEAMALYAGQSVGLIRNRRPAGRIVRDLVEEAEAVLGGLVRTAGEGT